MIKFSNYYNEEHEKEVAINDILRYARSKELFVWQVQFENDAKFTELNQPDNFVIHAWLVERQELGHLLHEEQEALDDIPF